MRRILVLALPALFACNETPVSVHTRSDALTEDTDPAVEPYDPLAPVADAGEDFAAHPLREVILDGTRSYDPQDRPIIPTWRLVSVPKGSGATLDRADSMEPVFFADLVGEYVIELGVQNDMGRSDLTPDQVVVHVVPATSIYVQLTWDAEVDLDLHLVPAEDDVWGREDCTWCNMSPDWGEIGEDRDDPSLDADTIDGFGPETITILDPSEGRFTAYVDYYGEGGDIGCRADCPETTATLDVYVDGHHVQQMQRTLFSAGDLWTGLTVDWPSERLEIHDELGWTELDDCQ